MLKTVESKYLKDKIPEFKSGDNVKLHVRIKEGDKERIQVFQGDVIAMRGSGINASITVRKVSSGIGVERIFPLHSPNLIKIQVVRRGDVNRAKLYYLRGRTGKRARISTKTKDKK